MLQIFEINYCNIPGVRTVYRIYTDTNGSWFASQTALMFQHFFFFISRLINDTHLKVTFIVALLWYFLQFARFNPMLSPGRYIELDIGLCSFFLKYSNFEMHAESNL